MADVIRQVTLEQGIDPRELSLLAYGGAGPLFATLLADELEMSRVIIPRFAGNFSACGRLMQDVVSEAGRTLRGLLTEEHLGTAATVTDELFEELAARESANGHPGGSPAVAREPSLDVRYAGQEHTLNVPVAWGEFTSAEVVDQVRSDFTDQHRQRLGYGLGDVPLEVVTVRARTRAVLERAESARHPVRRERIPGNNVEAEHLAPRGT